ncbi:glycine cleavage system aminomethyltransferase GcvT [Kocuria rhizophila]|uniref:aminomethyltransferase n=1 Tax=Kocuria rhizophila (strain ATCC 9341 / DSM 348 / NBRC 103217 / DC2201) TaxID=378753 RepID=B2GIJ7_KOCRD|nr:glycine cleavage system aminomethyltransferase GcvT [Kocuria rhizophila]ASE11087.1 glycine cleavage system protein T [Kocuria rhizophila]BAG28946.1 aminomethyltransferase [Kocuria rhizophila DC2201]VEH75765.1 Aminomethyltransferase [Kocuria rhizophila]
MSERRTALHGAHERLGARFTDFGGWSMPVRYASDTAEHHAVRRGAGIFDLSHMGEVEVTGPQAGAFLDHALVGVLSGIGVGRAKYSVIVDEAGRVLDDLITYRLGEERYLVVPNAGNQDTVVEALQQRAEAFDVTVQDRGPETSLIAVQGPRALEVLRATGLDPAEEVAGLKYYACAVARCGGVDVLAARTGYTGEDGFELYCANADAETLWNALLATAEELGTEDAPVQPAGLAARDSLRLEAGMPLYGHELSTEITPVEAGLGKLVEVALRKKDESGTRTVGHDALAAMLRSTPERTLIGLEGLGRKPIRAGYTVLSGERTIGEVTSGLPSPTLGKPVAMALVATDALDEIAAGTVSVQDARGRGVEVARTAMPFYTRG